MGRFGGGIEGIKEKLKKYGSTGTPYFSDLKDDGDTAKVRMLYTDAESLDIDIIHEIEVGGKKKRIQCLAEDGDCPLCSMGKPTVKLFLFLYNCKSNQIEVWERGQTMAPDLFGFIERYGYLNNRDYEIVRHGKKGDNKTKYQFFPGDKGPIVVNVKNKGTGQFEQTEITMPDKPDLYKTLIEIWTADQMSDYIAENSASQRNRDSASSGSNRRGF